MCPDYFVLCSCPGRSKAVYLDRTSGAKQRCEAGTGADKSFDSRRGNAANRIISDILSNQPGYKIVGIIDDDFRKKGSLLYGIKVVGTRRDIMKVCKEYEVREILLAIPSLSAADKNEILNLCNQTLCKVRTLPSLEEIINFDELRTSVRDIQIEDLLARDPIRLDCDKISDYIRGKTILVTGAAVQSAPSCAGRLHSFVQKCSISLIFTKTMPTI